MGLLNAKDKNIDLANKTNLLGTLMLYRLHILKLCYAINDTECGIKGAFPIIFQTFAMKEFPDATKLLAMFKPKIYQRSL